MEIVMLVGSLRAGSSTARLAGAFADLFGEDVRVRAYAGLADLPHYSEDLDTDDAPIAVRALRDIIDAADGLIVTTPEYNGSLPGALKNAIDWTSRPRGSAAIAGKPTAVVSVSPSPRGAQWAREDAEKVLRVAGASPLESSVGIGGVHQVLDGDRISDPDVRRELEHLAADLVAAVSSEQRAAA